MSILVVGSVALDTVRTPFGHVADILGGSATYFSASASFFAPVKIVAVVGEDFPSNEMDFLVKKGVDLSGLEIQKGKTFRWLGRYGYDLNDAETIKTELNVFENFQPKIKEEYKNTPYLFLANIDPDLQREVLEQMNSPKVVVCDTMNYWIESKRFQLLNTMAKVNIMLLNETEARQLSGEPNLIKSARIIKAYGPEIVIIKKGEHGALLFTKDCIFSAPAYPLEEIYDPTGAGDSFAGGFLGWLAKADEISLPTLKRAMIYGSAMASFCVENFGPERFKTLSTDEIKARFMEFKKFSEFETQNV